jgi:hypothetical protein
MSERTLIQDIYPLLNNMNEHELIELNNETIRRINILSHARQLKAIAQFREMDRVWYISAL